MHSGRPEGAQRVQGREGSLGGQESRACTEGVLMCQAGSQEWGVVCVPHGERDVSSG